MTGIPHWVAVNHEKQSALISTLRLEIAKLELVAEHLLTVIQADRKVYARGDQGQLPNLQAHLDRVSAALESGAVVFELGQIMKGEEE